MDSEIKELWGDALSYIRSKIEETAFQTWFDGLEINGKLIEANPNYSDLVIIVAGSGPTDMNGNNKLYATN